MIISASYKTDIPTFYGEWFIRRLRAGFCGMVNPYNRQKYRVNLDRASVDGFVFWTKNIGPFLKYLSEVKERGFPFIVQHTINGYPRALETSVVDWQRSVEMAWRVRESFGRRALVWRYDTILFSSLTPAEFHIENFARLSERLDGAADEVVVSFAQIYKKTKRNLALAAEETGFEWWDPDTDEKRALLLKLLELARRHHMQLTVCSQKDLVVDGTEDARCVDARRLTEIAGGSLHTRLKGNRKDCGCYESRDIGEYDTCPHGCVYCYAVQNRTLALGRYRDHNPDSDFLFDPEPGGEPEPSGGRQLGLFGE